MRGCLAGINIAILAAAPASFAEGLEFLDGRVFVADELCMAALGDGAGYAEFMQMAGPYILFGGPSGRMILPTGYPGSCLLGAVVDDNLVGRIDGGPAMLTTVICADPDGQTDERPVVVEYDAPSQVSIWPMGVPPGDDGAAEMFRSYRECEGERGRMLTEWFIDGRG